MRCGLNEMTKLVQRKRRCEMCTNRGPQSRTDGPTERPRLLKVDLAYTVRAAACVHGSIGG